MSKPHSQAYNKPFLVAFSQVLMQDGWTPLHFAAYGGALEVTQFLLVKGANPDPKDVVCHICMAVYEVSNQWA